MSKSLKKIFCLSLFTLNSLIKDRVFIIILSSTILFLLVPVFSSFSLRQIQEVSITLSISLHSFILLMLSLFAGISTIWRDIERKFIYNILSYPLSRNEYIVGRFLGCLFLIIVVSVINIILSCIAIYISSCMYKSRLPLVWANILTAFGFVILKYILLMGFNFLFASFSTSFFVPFFLTIAVYIIGNCSQGIYEYIISSYGKNYPTSFKFLIKSIYYVLPNFSSFDFTVFAAYSLHIKLNDVLFTLAYFFLYFSIIFFITCIIFSKRDLT